MQNRIKKTIFGLVVSSFIGTSAVAAPFNPVLKSKSSNIEAEANPVVKVGNPYTISGIEYKPEVDDNYDSVGLASWYGDDFNGKLTSNGEVFDMDELTAAHPTLPMPSFVEVTNLENGRKVIVRINDRGPFANGRIIDLSKRAAQFLQYEDNGTAKVRVKFLPEISKEAAEELNRVNSIKNAAMQGSSEAVVVSEQPISSEEPAAVSEAVSEVPASNNIEMQKANLLEQPVEPVQVAKKEDSLRSVSLQEPGNVHSYVPKGVFVQVGAFSNNNEKIQAQMSSLSDIGVVSLQRVDLDGKDILRLRVGPYGSIDDAIKVQERLSSLGYGSSRVVIEQ